ncbi:hypothetical protein AX16_008842 [Volvariella volvacea WC 439]|nr:hypothetical protein AX16_008842 [Volvariella volvacea WC 439]
MTNAANAEHLLVQIASYNTNLQGDLALPQDLVDWLAPTLQVSTFLSPDRRAPDIVAVGFQELLPLHLGLSGFSKAVLQSRGALILSQIEAHAPNEERYSLIAQVVNVGVALLVFARDDGTARKVCDVQTQWTGCGPMYMGNKGAVGVRFRIPGSDNHPGETYTFVCAHLAPHDENVNLRIANYKHIVASLLFPSAAGSTELSTIFDSSHLFFFGDLNFRLQLPVDHQFASSWKSSAAFFEALSSDISRKELKEYDQLLIERRKGTAFVGLHEGEFWKFKCSYKYTIGEVDKYSTKRIPSWTDRVLYATHLDSPDTPFEQSKIVNLLYTSIPSYTTSDHKPIVSLLAIPSSAPGPIIPTIRLPPNHNIRPDGFANIKKYTGRVIGRVIGIFWWLLTVIGVGSSALGTFNLLLGLGAWKWWRARSGSF